MEESLRAVYMGVAAGIFILALGVLLVIYKGYIDVTYNEQIFGKEAVIHYER